MIIDPFYTELASLSQTTPIFNLHHYSRPTELRLQDSCVTSTWVSYLKAYEAKPLTFGTYESNFRPNALPSEA